MFPVQLAQLHIERRVGHLGCSDVILHVRYAVQVFAHKRANLPFLQQPTLVPQDLTSE